MTDYSGQRLFPVGSLPRPERPKRTLPQLPVPSGLLTHIDAIQAAEEALRKQNETGSDVPGVPKKGVFLGDNTENRMQKELHGLAGFFAGIPKGIGAIIGDTPRLLPGGEAPKLIPKLPGAIAHSFLETGKHIVNPVSFYRDAMKGTWTETFLNDLGNISMILSGGAFIAGKVSEATANAAVLASDAAKAGQVGEAERALALSQTAEKLDQVHQVLQHPYRWAGKKVISDPLINLGESTRLARSAGEDVGLIRGAGGRAGQLLQAHGRLNPFAIEMQRQGLATAVAARQHPIFQVLDQAKNYIAKKAPHLDAKQIDGMLGEEVRHRLEQMDPIKGFIKERANAAGIRNPGLDTTRLRGLKIYDDPQVQKYLADAIDQFPDFEKKFPFLQDVAKEIVPRHPDAIALEQEAYKLGEQSSHAQTKFNQINKEIGGIDDQLVKLQDPTELIPDAQRLEQLQALQEKRQVLSDQAAGYHQQYTDTWNLQQRRIAEMQKLDDHVTLMNDIPRNLRPQFQQFLDARQRFAKILEKHPRGIDPASYGQLMDELPKNYVDFIGTLNKLGIDPEKIPRIADFSDTTIQSLMSGRRRLGHEFDVGTVAHEGERNTPAPGHFVTAPGEMPYTGLNRETGAISDSPNVLAAMAGEKTWRDTSNMLAQWIEDNHIVVPIPPHGQIPRGFVKWDEGRMIPKSFKRTLDHFAVTDNPSGLLLRGSSQVLDAYRTGVLHFSPGWMLKHTLGTLFLSGLAEPGEIFNLGSWAKGWRSFRNKGMLEHGTEVMYPFADVPAEITVGGGVVGELGATSKGGGEGVFSQIPVVKQVHDFTGNIVTNVDKFMRSFVYRGELKKAVKRGNLPQLVKDAETGAKTYVKGELLDTDSILHKVEQGKDLSPAELHAVETATQNGINAMVDYGNMSPWERKVMRRIIPFYAWQKNLAKLAISLPLDHPARFAALEQISNHLGGFSKDERSMLPEWMIPSFGLGKSGARISLPVNPLQDSLSLFRPDFTGIYESLNPVLSEAIGALQHKAKLPFGPEEVGKGGFGQQIWDPKKEILGRLGQIPITGLFNSLMSGTAPGSQLARSPAESLLSFFGAKYRNPEEVQKYITSLQKQRRATLISRVREEIPPITAPNQPADLLINLAQLSDPLIKRRRSAFSRAGKLALASPLLPLQTGSL